ncbi:MAG: hypothetical protein COB62_05845 [Piscirickettsiaceae bacterium]|nr:MAG: hypothetical protein COB62_05845 [Piscirickettsiaceae bacterium]
MEKEILEPLLKQTLDERANSLPGHIQSALTQARYSAVMSASEAKKKRTTWLWGGMATAASITLAVLLWQPVPFNPTDQGLVFEDMDLLAAEDELGFYVDLEFIAWLDEIEGSG